MAGYITVKRAGLLYRPLRTGFANLKINKVRRRAMIKKHLFFVAVYLRLSREDSASEAGPDFDGSTKAESNSISSQRR